MVNMEMVLYTHSASDSYNCTPLHILLYVADNCFVIQKFIIFSTKILIMFVNSEHGMIVFHYISYYRLA
jgi:hypothetical protein